MTACCWSPAHELYTCSDDHTVAKWSMEGEYLGKVCDLDSYATDMHWLPAVGHQAADQFIVSCTDGKQLQRTANLQLHLALPAPPTRGPPLTPPAVVALLPWFTQARSV